MSCTFSLLNLSLNKKDMNIEDKDWLKLERFFVHLFLQEGYNHQCSERLGFYIRQNLQNALPLINTAKNFLESNNFELINSELEEMMIQVHMLLSNYDNLETAHKILKSYESVS